MGIFDGLISTMPKLSVEQILASLQPSSLSPPNIADAVAAMPPVMSTDGKSSAGGSGFGSDALPPAANNGLGGLAGGVGDIAGGLGGFLNDYFRGLVPHQPDYAATMDARQKLAVALGSQTGPQPSPVNVSPQIAGSGLGATSLAAQDAAGGGQPANPAGISGFNYGGGFTPGGFDSDKIKSAVMALVQSGNSEAAMSLLNLNKPPAPISVSRDSNLVQPDGVGGYNTVYQGQQEPDYVDGGAAINPATSKLERFMVDKRDPTKKIFTGQVPPKISFVNGQAVDENSVVPGTVIPQQAERPSAGLTPDAEAQRIRIEAAQERNRATNSPDNIAAPVQIGFTGPDGEEKQTAASFNRKTGQYLDAATGQPIVNPQNLRVIGNATGGARSAAAVSRVLTNAEDATSGIENLTNISSKGSGGLFPNLATTPLSALSRAVTPQEVQDVQATMAGLGRAMGGLATGGLAVDESVQKSYEGLAIHAGDSQITAMRKLAEMRQQSTNALDVQSVSPILSPEQKKTAAALSARIRKAVPWTVQDVQNLENSNNPNISMRDLATQQLNSPAPVSGTSRGVKFRILPGN